MFVLSVNVLSPVFILAMALLMATPSRAEDQNAATRRANAAPSPSLSSDRLPAAHGNVSTLPEGLRGEWKLAKIGSKRSAPGIPALFSFGPNNQFTGKAGCNGMTRRAIVNGDTLKFGPALMTRMMCPGVRMRQEIAVGEAMQKVRGWRVSGSTLELSDSLGKALLTFTSERRHSKYKAVAVRPQ